MYIKNNNVVDLEDVTKVYLPEVALYGEIAQGLQKIYKVAVDLPSPYNN